MSDTQGIWSFPQPLRSSEGTGHGQAEAVTGVLMYQNVCTLCFKFIKTNQNKCMYFMITDSKINFFYSTLKLSLFGGN